MRNGVRIPGFVLLLLISSYASILYADKSAEQVNNQWDKSETPGVSVVEFQPYNDTCGGCHFAYQPGLLPAMSWEKIISNTDNHFGKKLTLTSAESTAVLRYLLDNSAGRVNDAISNNILQSLTYNPVIIRITQTPYYMSKHPQLKGSDKSKTAGQCNTCHQGAVKGMF